MPFGPAELADLKRIHTELGALIVVIEGAPPPPPSPPVINSFSASPASITVGQSTLLSWTISGQVDVAMLNGTDGSNFNALGLTQLSVSPLVSVTYTLSASNTGGAATPAQTTVAVTPVPPPPPSGFTWPGPGVNVTITQPVALVMGAEAQDVTVAAGGSITIPPSVSTSLKCRKLTVELGGEVIWTVSDPTVTCALQFDAIICKGKFHVHGAPRSRYSRLAASALAGATTLNLALPVIGWQGGDSVLVTDSRTPPDPGAGNVAWQSEVKPTTGVTGQSVSLASSLAFAHLNGWNSDPLYFPHAANLTSNVKFTSISGTPRGWTRFDGADIDITDCEFVGLGRETISTSNGWYAVELMNNCVGRFEGNTVWDAAASNTFIWGIYVHNCNNGLLVRGNVVHNWDAAGMMVRDSTARIDGNLVCKVTRGNGAGRADTGGGKEGCGFWLYRSTGATIINNIACNCHMHGFLVFEGGPFFGFAGNEAYGGRQGMTFWYINGASTATPNPGAPESFIDNLKVWRCWEFGYGLGYDGYNITWRNLTVRLCGKAWYSGDYRTRNFKVINADIRDCPIGIVPSMVDVPGEFLIDHPVFAGNASDVHIEAQVVGGGGGWVPAARTVRIVGSTPPAQPALKITGTDSTGKTTVIVQ